GKHQTKAYPTIEELLQFGSRVCGVAKPAEVLQRIADAMAKTLIAGAADERIPPELLRSMREVWEDGMTYAIALRG
ncbi:MAG: type II toxin-antitoxin system HipA family toxin, partial [Variovorax sp.]